MMMLLLMKVGLTNGTCARNNVVHKQTFCVDDAEATFTKL